MLRHLSSFCTHSLCRLLARCAPSAVFFVDTKSRRVALTIDDGPSRENMGEMLDLLAAYSARATFFVLTEKIPGNEDLLQRAVDTGHELGHHMYRDEPTMLLSADAFRREFAESDQALKQFGGTRWFRPGGAFYTGRMLTALQDFPQYQIALGSVFPLDSHIPSTWFAETYISLNVRPGSIMVLHDGPKRGRRTCQTLRRLLPKLQELDLEVVTLSELCETS